MKYLDQMKEDILEYIEENGIEVAGRPQAEVMEQLFDDLWIEDSVTGNGSGSYTFSRADARKNVLDDGFNYLGEMIREYGLDSQTIGNRFIAQDWEWFDVSIRCFLLDQAITAALDELAGKKGGE